MFSYDDIYIMMKCVCVCYVFAYFAFPQSGQGGGAAEGLFHAGEHLGPSPEGLGERVGGG